jgi:hypothetical protein
MLITKKKPRSRIIRKSSRKQPKNQKRKRNNQNLKKKTKQLPSLRLRKKKRRKKNQRSKKKKSRKRNHQHQHPRYLLPSRLPKNCLLHRKSTSINTRTIITAIIIGTRMRMPNELCVM